MGWRNRKSREIGTFMVLVEEKEEHEHEHEQQDRATWVAGMREMDGEDGGSGGGVARRRGN